MLRTATVFLLGILVAALPVNALSVYVLHDFNKNEVGQANAAFAGLAFEVVVFSVVASLLLVLFLWLGRRLVRAPVARPHLGLVLLLGAATIVAQYIFDMAARMLTPIIAEGTLTAYLLISPAVCAAILLKHGVSRESATTQL